MHRSSSLIDSILDSLSGPAIVVDRELRIKAANQLYHSAYARGQEVRDRHCYEASHDRSAPCTTHGESCPIERCRETGNPSSALHLHTTTEGEQYTQVTTRSLHGEDEDSELFIVILKPLGIDKAEPHTDGPISEALEIVPLDEMEKCYLGWVVDHYAGDNRSLAKRLGLSERTFYRKLQRLRGSR